MLFSSNAFFLFYYITSVKKNPKSHSSVPACFCAHYIVVFWLCKLKVFLSGDIETNLGPAQKNQNKLFSICHWDLNGITAHGYVKVSLLKAYITAHKMDITCLSETYFSWAHHFVGNLFLMSSSLQSCMHLVSTSRPLS